MFVNALKHSLLLSCDSVRSIIMRLPVSWWVSACLHFSFWQTASMLKEKTVILTTEEALV